MITPKRIRMLMLFTMVMWAISGINMIVSYLTENFAIMGVSAGCMLLCALIYTIYQKILDTI